MTDKKQQPSLLWVVIVLFLITGCDAVDLGISDRESSDITASGIVEAREISVAAEIGGKIRAIQVSEGDQVERGELLFSLDNETISAKQDQAAAQLASARSTLSSAQASLSVTQAEVESAQIGLEIAQLKMQQVLQTSRNNEAPFRVEDWDQDSPPEVGLPSWYFHKEEQKSAAELEQEDARENYETEKERYREILQESGNGEAAQAEERLAEAQAAFSVAESLLDHAVGFEGRQEIRDYRQTIYDAAEAELDAAQQHYHQILSDQEAQDILEGRARLTVARERYELARDQVQQFNTGEDALIVQEAKLGLKQARAARDQAKARQTQAQAGVEQAQKSVQQAEASLALIKLQLNKHRVTAPLEGVILTRTIEPGEIIQPGTSAMTIGDLEALTVTVYIPEDRYGKISLGDQARLQVDSYPEDVFRAEVVRIADQAEYTPRNVQTKEERQKTVYAVELAVKNGNGKLKPGMPTDVTFELQD